MKTDRRLSEAAVACWYTPNLSSNNGTIVLLLAVRGILKLHGQPRLLMKFWHKSKDFSNNLRWRWRQ